MHASSFFYRVFAIVLCAPLAHAIQIGPSSLPDATGGVPYSAQLTASGGMPPYTFHMLSATTWAAGMSVGTNGLISGTPPVGLNTILTPKIMVSDSAGASVIRDYEIRLHPGSTPELIFQTANLGTAVVGEFFRVNITATGGLYPLTYSSLDPLPPGITLTNDNVHGVLDGPAGAAGTYTFRIRAVDSDGLTAVKQYTLTVTPAPLQLGGTALPEIFEGMFFRNRFRAIHGQAPYEFSVVNGQLPAGLTLSSTGLLSGIPSAPGGASFTVRLRDSLNEEASSEFFVNVQGKLLDVSPRALPGIVLGDSRFQDFTVNGPTPWYFDAPVPSAGSMGWGITSASNGLALSTSDMTAGFKQLRVQGQDGLPRLGTRTYLVKIWPDGTQQTDNDLRPVSFGPSHGPLFRGRVRFDFTSRFPAGPPAAPYVQILFSKQGLNAANACYISYDATANVFYLLSDDMTYWFGLLGGQPGTVGNGQCTIHGSGSGFPEQTGTDIAAFVDISFRSGFSGDKKIYQLAGTAPGGNSGWWEMGTWGDTGDPAAIEITGLNPSSGNSATQTFTAEIKDGDDADTIPFVQFLMNASLQGTNGCFIHYDRVSNAFFLLSDDAGAWSGIIGGSDGSVANSQCSLSGLGSGGVGVGKTLTITYQLTLAPTFSGPKKVFLQTVDDTGIIESWHQMGTWTY